MKNYPELGREERIAKALEQRHSELVLVLENLAEELNVSAILRTAEGFGVSEVNIIHQVGRKPKLSKHASSGASKWLKISYFTSTYECLNSLKKVGFKIVGAVVDPKAPVLWKSNLKGKVAVLLGNEAHGLSVDACELSDCQVYIPMVGLTESLNVSVAAALFLYEAVRQRVIENILE